MSQAFSTRDQPAPIPGDAPVLSLILPAVEEEIKDLNNTSPFGPVYWRQLKVDLIARGLQGEQRYGRPLETNNGRDALIDWYQEAIDGLMYAYQTVAENKGSPKVDMYKELAVLQLALAISITKILVDRGY